MTLGSTNTIQIVIRTDASVEIGTGHVMRCLTLASGLAQEGAEVRFLCRAHNGNLINFIKRCGFRVEILNSSTLDKSQSNFGSDPAHAAWLGCDWHSDAQQCRFLLSDKVDWLIVDHYALDHRWERVMRTTCQRIMVIDDLADRPHDCDLLLDPSLGRTETDYRDIVRSDTQLLLGPEYALLRPEFAQWRATSLARREAPKLRHILVTMGGVDRDNVTGRVLATLNQIRLPTVEKITVILGRLAPWRNEVHIAAAGMRIPTIVLSGVDNVAELISSCDLAIGAGGTTTWERCSLGVPSVLLVLADNQLNIAKQMTQADAAFVVSDLNSLELSLMAFLESFGLFDKMQIYARHSSSISDASGVARTITNLVGHNA